VDDEEHVADTRTSYTAKGQITITATPTKGDTRAQSVPLLPHLSMLSFIITFVLVSSSRCRRTIFLFIFYFLII
jgi:hypothetical protein